MNRVLDELKRISFLHLFLVSVIPAEILTFIIIVPLSIVFRGRITYDYLITGAIAAFFVSLIGGTLILFFTKELQKNSGTLRLFEKSAETTQLGITISDIEGKILYTNPAEAGMHGYKVEELIGKYVQIFAPPEISNPMTLEQIKNMKRFKRESVNIRKDGSMFPVQLMSDVVIDENGFPRGIVTSCEDITERKKAEKMLKEAYSEMEMRVKERTEELTRTNEQLQRDITERNRLEKALRDSEERYRSLFETAKDTIFLLSTDGTFTSLNPMFETITGWPCAEWLGKSFVPLIHPDDLDLAMNVFSRVLKGESISFELRVLTRSGKYKVGEFTSSPLMKDEGLIGFLGVGRDITERKKAEEKIRLYQDQCRALIVKLALLEEQERRRISEELHDNISQNLAFAKIKIASLKESEPSTDIAGDLDEIRRLLDEAIRFTRSLTFELSPPVLYKLGFEAAIKWIIDKIQESYGVTVDFVSDGRVNNVNGEISILLYKTVRELLMNVVKHAHASKVQVAIGRDGNNIRIAVDDNGIGFDVEKLYGYSGKIETFGLFSINERINYLGGTTKITSQPKQGTLIDLIVPIEPNTNKDLL